MRSYYMIMVFSVVFGLISGGCRFKEREYGKFTEEEVSKMGYPETDGLSAGSGGLTLSIMGETVTADEVVNNDAMIGALRAMADDGIYEIFTINARPVIARVVMSKVSDILIFHLAKKNAPANIDEILEKAVEKEVNRHVTNYGNNFAKAEEAFKKMGFADWDAFREYKKKLVLTQFYISKKIKSNRPIMHSEIVARYKARKRDYVTLSSLKMRVIEIDASKLDADEIDSANDETAGQAAARKGRKIAQLINDGGDFGKLAEAHSDGFGNKNGGMWDEVTVGAMAEPYDVLEKAAEKMKAGDVSDVIEADGHVFIMKLVEKTEGSTVPFSVAQGEIKAELGFINQRIEYNKVLMEILEQADARDMEVFTDYCLERAYEIITGSN